MPKHFLPKKQTPLEKQERRDSYVNTRTGHGGASRINETEFQGNVYLGKEQERMLHRSDDVAQKIIEEPVYDMFSAGIDWQEDKDEISVDTLKEIEEGIEKHKLIDGVAVMAGILANRSGAGFAYFTFDDGATTEELAEPLNELRVSEIIRIDVVDKWDCLPLTTYDDPQHPKFREPETYRLLLYGYRTQLNIVVHESRLARFDSPIRSDQMTRARNMGSNDGVLVPVYDKLKMQGVVVESVGSVAERFFVNTYKTKGVIAAIASGSSAVFSRIFDLFNNGHNENTIALEHGEEYTREAAPVQGLAELVPTFYQVIAHASKLPLYKFWTEAGALGGDNHDGTESDYHSVIRYRQKTVGRSFLDQLFKFLALTIDFDPAKLKYNFNPLREDSAKQKAETMKLVFEAYSLMMSNGVLQAETVAENVFSGKEIDLTSMTVDMQEWQQMKEDDEASDIETQTLINEGMKDQGKPKPKGKGKENPDQMQLPEK